MPKIFSLATGQSAAGSGTSASTAAAVTIECGFEPMYVKVVAIDTNCVTTEWFYEMDAAKGIQNKEDTGYKSAALASNGITVNSRGFIIGTAAQVNSKKYHWIALG